MDGRACDMQRAKGSKAGKLTEIAMQRNGMKGTRQVTSTHTHTHSLFFNWMVSDAYPSLPRAKNTRMQCGCQGSLLGCCLSESFSPRWRDSLWTILNHSWHMSESLKTDMTCELKSMISRIFQYFRVAKLIDVPWSWLFCSGNSVQTQENCSFISHIFVHTPTYMILPTIHGFYLVYTPLLPQ